MTALTIVPPETPELEPIVGPLWHSRAWLGLLPRPLRFRLLDWVLDVPTGSLLHRLFMYEVR